jgi:hypothetical protein
MMAGGDLKAVQARLLKVVQQVQKARPQGIEGTGRDAGIGDAQVVSILADAAEGPVETAEMGVLEAGSARRREMGLAGTATSVLGARRGAKRRVAGPSAPPG